MKSKITDDIKTALKSGDKKRVGVLRLISAAIKQKEVDTRTELDDSAIIVILEKMIKQRKESIKYFAEAQREDLLEQEKFECEVIMNYLPEPLGSAELERLIDDLIKQTGSTGIKDMGKVMAMLKAHEAGRIDMQKASDMVKRRLT